MLALLDLSKMCRVCRDDSDCLLDMFVDSFLPNKGQEPTLAEMLSKCSGCRVDRADGLPQFVCTECAMATRGAYRLRQQCRRSMQYFGQLLGMAAEADGKGELDLGDLEPSQETSNAIGLTEAEGQAFHGDETNLEPLYVELVASSCLVPEIPKKGNTQLHGINDNRSLESSLDESNASPKKKLRSNSRSSSDDSWSPSLSKKATKKPRTLRDSSCSESPSDGSSKKVKRFPCTQCTRSFNQKGNLQSHIRVHTGERPFKCTYCSQTFKQRGHLDVHIRVHTGEKPFKCSHCSYSCNQKAGLNSHVKAVHRGY